MRPVLAWPDWSDSAAITGSAALTGCPLSNLLTKQPKQVWASANVSSPIYMELDRGSAQWWNTVSVLHSNASKNATWRVRAAATQGALVSGTPYDHGAALDLSGSGQYAAQAFASTGSLPAYTVIVRFSPDTARLQGIVQLTGSYTTSIRQAADTKVAVTFTSATTLAAPTTIAANVWAHIAVVVSGSTATLYQDGVEVISNGDADPGNFNAITIGYTDTNRLDGVADDVQLWTRALTAAEVLADFEHGGTRTTPQSGLHSYFALDGSTRNDGSVGGSLTLTGSPGYAAGSRFTASPFDRLAGSDRRHSLLWVPSGANYRWLRIDIDDPKNTDAVFEAGRVVVGNGWQFVPTYPGMLPSFTDDTQVEILPGGQSAINARTPVPTATVNLRAYTEAELLTYLYEIAARRGSSKDVLFVRDPDPAYVFREHGLVYGLVQNGLTMNLPEYGRFESSLTVRGLL